MASDTGYERAIERLQELLEADRTLNRFLDREYDFYTSFGNNGLCVDTVPRPIFHKRRVYGNIEHQPFPSAIELKVDALRKAIEQADAPNVTKEDTDTGSTLERNMQNLAMLLKIMRR